jgi:hypothetical protein
VGPLALVHHSSTTPHLALQPPPYHDRHRTSTDIELRPLRHYIHPISCSHHLLTTISIPPRLPQGKLSPPATKHTAHPKYQVMADGDAQSQPEAGDEKHAAASVIRICRKTNLALKTMVIDTRHVLRVAQRSRRGDVDVQLGTKILRGIPNWSLSRWYNRMMRTAL